MRGVNNIRSVLVVGSYGTFVENLINKLNKEEWRIFTLVSDKFCAKPARVFEQYNFDYTSDSISEVIGSCRPDVILFTGAYDLLYQWREKTQRADSKNFIVSLNNLLICAKENSVEHFVYLSSECVFEEPSEVNISEDEELTPVSYKGMTIAQGEKMALSFNRLTSMEVSIVRVANLYFIPKNNKECRDKYTNMCMKAVSSGRIEINAKEIASPLYIGDAVHAIFLLINAHERKYNIYHISAEEAVSELDIAQAIKSASTQPVTIIDQTKGYKKRIILSNQRFGEEFSFQVRSSYSNTVPLIVKSIWKHRNKFSINNKSNKSKSNIANIKKLFEKILPLFECVIVFFFIISLNSLTTQVSFLQNVDFYLLFVLLFAATCGRQMAIFAFALSVVGYCYQQLNTQDGLKMLLNTNTYMYIVELFIVGITAGHLKEKLTQLQVERDEEIQYLSGRIDEISSINSTNLRIKNYFEELTVNSNESIGWFYDIITNLDSAESGEVMFIAIATLSKIMGTNDVAIYSVSDDNFCRIITSTTPRGRSLGKSMYIPQYEEIFEPLRSGNIYVNRSMDMRLPSLASALTDTNGSIQFVFLLWDMAYDKMTLYYINTLKVLDKLIYNAVMRSEQYLDLLQHKRYIFGTRILQQYAFEEMLAIYQRACKNKLTEYFMLVIDMEGHTVNEWNKKLNDLIRQADIIGMLSDEKIGIILTNTNEAEAHSVMFRLQSSGVAVKAYNNTGA